MRVLSSRAGVMVGVGGWLGLAVACGGWPGRPTEQGGVSDQVSGLEGTRLAEVPPALATMPFDGGGGTGPMSVGAGVQVPQVFPVGGVRDPLQVVVVFDRPMVPLTDLDTMAQSVPVTCAPEVGAVPRWAGTSTAVLVAPPGGFPDATRYTCSVPAGTKAVDGTKLERGFSFEFQTPTLTLTGHTPEEGDHQVDPESPIEVAFDQDLTPDQVKGRVRLRTEAGTDVPFTVTAHEREARRYVLEAKLSRDTGYTVTVPAGAVGSEGTLPTPADQSFAFRTYPPLDVVRFAPEGKSSADGWFSVEFSTPVPADAVREHLTLTPEPPGWDPPEGSWAWTHWSYGVRLAPDTDYVATLGAGLEDTYGQALGRERTWRFHTGGYDPTWALPAGVHLYPAANPKELPFRHVNLRQLQVWSGAVDPRSVANAWDDPVVAGAPWDVPIDAPHDASELDVLDLSPHLSPDGYGWVGARFFTPDLRREHGGAEADGIYVVTDLGATVKFVPGSTEVFVTSLRTGEPVADVEVTLRSKASEQPIGKTDARGLLKFDGAPVATWDRWDDPLTVLLRKGNDTSVVFADWTPTYGWFSNDGDEVRSYGFADRGLYRLGDEVHGHVSFRRADRHGLSAVSGNAKWTLSDPRGATLASGEVPLEGDGVVEVDTKLPATGPLGTYALRFDATGADWTSAATVDVPVKAYRPAAFRVEVSGPDAAVVGETVTLHADARYLFGAPMKRAEVVFRGWAHETRFRPDGFDAFEFGPEIAWWEQDDERAVTPRIADARPALVDGKAAFTVPLTDESWAGKAWEVSLEAAVTDVDHQTLASARELTVLPAAYGVGLRPTAWVAEKGKEAAVELVTVGGDGAVLSDRPIELVVSKRDFDSVRERGMDGRWRYVSTKTDTRVTAGSARSGAAPVRFAFTPTEPGLHVIAARSTDDAGHTTVSETSIYVAGGDASWAREEGVLRLLPDQKQYRVGDTAKVVVKGGVPGSWALVTVEREGILWREVVKLEGTSPVVSIPLAEGWLPGVRVSVAAVTGAGPQDAPDKGRPELLFGTVDLDVDSSDRHLAVVVETVGTEFGPRDEVEVSVAVSRAGTPVDGARVLLYAVDEGVLTLTNYQTPDPFDVMYLPHATNVVTLDNRMAVLDRAHFLTKGATQGGGGADFDPSGPEIRSKFLTTITWQSTRTGKDGRLEAKFTLPDNLTAFRVMAVAEQADTFGADDTEIRVSRPLVLRPALPRLLREGDETYAGVVVHNHTGAEQSVTVSATSSGPVQIEGAPATVNVPAEGAVEVPFHLTALEVGEVELTFQGVMGDEKDGVVAKLPVRRDVRIETVGSGGLVDGTVTEQIARPDAARPGFGGLEVGLGTTVLVGTDDALGYLLDYPYGCVEQITSRGVGALALLRVHERSGSSLAPDTLRANVETVLARLPRFQTDEGGFAYWPGGWRPSIEGTRYVLEFLAHAKNQGFAVDDRLVDGTVRWLRDFESSWEFSQLSPARQRDVRAEVAIGLAFAGKGDAGLLSRVYEQRAGLSVQQTAELLSAIVQTTGRDGRTGELVRVVSGRSYVEANAASIREDHGPGSWGSDDRSTAAALEAFVRTGDQPLVPRYAMHLAQSRRAGRWHDTRATAAALFALAAYAETFETAGSEVDAVITLAGKELLHEKLPVPGRRSLTVPMADLANGPLDVTGQRVYYTTRLSYAPQQPKPREEGLHLSRTLELVDGGGANGELVVGATVRVTLTVLTPVDRYDVAVRDPFPAGFEPVDTSLATTSRADRERAEGDGEAEVPSGLPEFGGSSFDHHEIDDGEVRLFAASLSPGIHTYRYVLRATSPGRYVQPGALVEEMYEPENFGTTGGGTLVIGRGAAEVASR